MLQIFISPGLARTLDFDGVCGVIAIWLTARYEKSRILSSRIGRGNCLSWRAIEIVDMLEDTRDIFSKSCEALVTS